MTVEDIFFLIIVCVGLFYNMFLAMVGLKEKELTVSVLMMVNALLFTLTLIHIL